jgi:TRAP-type transport system periplasmic protein
MKAAVISVFALSAALGVYAQTPTTLKLATGYKANSFHTENLQQFAQSVRIGTQAQLNIEVVPNGELAKLGEIYPQVAAGKIAAGETIMSSLVKDFPIAGADSVPFIVSSYADAERMWALQRPLVERAMEKVGVKVLYAVPWPPQGLYAVKPVQDAQNFKGTKMRTYNAATVRIAELLGAKPVEVAMADVGKALAAGQIDSMITSAVTGVDNQVWLQVKHYYEINAWFPKNVVFIHLATFNAMPKATQDVVMREARSAEERGWAASQVAALNSTATLKAKGMKIEPTPPKLELEIKRLGERFSREWVRSVGNDANSIFIPYYTK